MESPPPSGPRRRPDTLRRRAPAAASAGVREPRGGSAFARAGPRKPRPPRTCTCYGRPSRPACGRRAPGRHRGRCSCPRPLPPAAALTCPTSRSCCPLSGALAERHRALSEAAKGGGRRTDATTLRRGGGTALGAAEGSAGLRLRCERGPGAGSGQSLRRGGAGAGGGARGRGEGGPGRAWGRGLGPKSRRALTPPGARWGLIAVSRARAPVVPVGGFPGNQSEQGLNGVSLGATGGLGLPSMVLGSPEVGK